MAKDTRYPKYLYGKTKEYPQGILNIPNYTKAYDFLYFQSGLGLTTRDPRLKPRFIKACSQFLFNTKKNDPYEQFKDGLAFLKYIFKDKKNLPSRQELSNIVSVAQLILYKYEVYKRPLNQLSISLNKNVVSKRWKEVFKVDKRKRQLTEARTKVDPKKRVGKKYFLDLEKQPQRERTRLIKSNKTTLKKLQRDWEKLDKRIKAIDLKKDYLIATGGFWEFENEYRKSKEKRDILYWQIKRLQRTLENIDPFVQPDLENDKYKKFMEDEIKQAEKKTTYIDVNTGKHIELKRDFVDWSKNQSYNRDSSKKSIWVSDIPNPKLKN